MTAGRLPRTGTQGPYFYLSHAHDASELDNGLAARDPDYWVEAFYSDLVDEINRRLDGRLTGDVGAYRACAVDGGDRTELSVVRTARAFVPLYSPAYLTDEHAKAERSTFIGAPNRLAARGRIVPVLWQPTPGGELTPELEEAASVSTIVAYRTKGVLELSRLQEHEDTYREVVDFLAHRIVEVVDGPNGNRAAPTSGPTSPDSPSARPLIRFVLTLVADEPSSPVFPVAKVITTDLVRTGHYEVVRVRYPDETEEGNAGLVLIDAAVLTDMPAKLRQHLLDLPADRFVIAVGISAGRLPVLDGALRERLLALDGRNARVQIREAPEPNAAIAKEVLGLIRRQSEGGWTEARPYPNRITLRD